MNSFKLRTIFFALLLFFWQFNIFAAQVALSTSDLPANFTAEQLQQAAAAGDPDAQYALGYMYYYGKNVEKDTSVAQDWIKRAAVQGQPQAISAMRMMGQNVAVAPNPLEAGQAAAANAGNAAGKPQQAASTAPTKSVQNIAAVQSTQQKQPKLSSHYYTIALLETGSLSVMQAYIKKHHLHGRANYVTSERNAKSWYSLTYGKYASLKAAKAGLKSLPASVKAQKPRIVGKNDLAA